MGLNRLTQYSAHYSAEDDNAALERAGHEWASAAGYDVPYDVAGIIGRLQVLAGKGRRWDAKRRRWIVFWNAEDEMHRVCAAYRRPEPESRAEPEFAPVEEPASLPEPKPSGRLGLAVERLLMRERADEIRRKDER